MPNKEYSQKAGNNATQVQNNLIKIGIGEKEVREMIKDEIQNAIEQMSIIAKNIANERLESYANILVPKLVKAEVLDSFSNPAIQVLFRQSERTAVCTARQKDYELLSELLIHRINKNGNYTTSAAIEKAIDEVNNISEEALLGLTITYSILTYRPTAGNIKLGLETLDELYGKIIKNSKLPVKRDWIDNLEIVRAVRISTNSKFKKLEDYYFESFKGYSCIGIKKNSTDYNKAQKILQDNNLPENSLVDNIFNDNYVRLNFFDLETFDNKKLLIQEDKLEVHKDLTIKQKKALKEIVDLYENNDKNKSKFVELLKEYKNINLLLEWWNENLIDQYYSITAIGRVIAHTCAKSIDSTLPDLD